MDAILTNPMFAKVVLLFGWVIVYGLWLTFKEGRSHRLLPPSKPPEQGATYPPPS